MANERPPREAKRPERLRKWGEIAGLTGATLSLLGSAILGPAALAFGAAGAAARYGLGAVAERREAREAHAEKLRWITKGFVRGVTTTHPGMEGSRLVAHVFPSKASRVLLRKAPLYLPPTEHTKKVFRPSALGTAKLRQLRRFGNMIEHHRAPVRIEHRHFSITPRLRRVR